MLTTILGMDSYILMAVIGFAAAFLTGFLRRKKYGFVPIDLVAMLCAGIAGLLLGSKLLFIITMIPEIIQNFGWEIIEQRVINGGLVFYGGLLGAMYAMYLVAKSMKRDVMSMMNFTIPCFAAFHFFGRIGCFLDGCCHGVAWERGVPCNAPFKCFPIQLVEAAGILIIFAVLMWLENEGFKKAKKIPLVPIYFLLYGVLRFVDEIWRGDVLRGVTVFKIDYFTSAQNSASITFSLSTSQIISLILIVFSAVYLYRLAKRGRGEAEIPEKAEAKEEDQ